MSGYYHHHHHHHYHHHYYYYFYYFIIIIITLNGQTGCARHPFADTFDFTVLKDKLFITHPKSSLIESQRECWLF